MCEIYSDYQFEWDMYEKESPQFPRVLSCRYRDQYLLLLTKSLTPGYSHVESTEIG